VLLVAAIEDGSGALDLDLFNDLEQIDQLLQGGQQMVF
jgi:hypothetical protein